MAGNSIECKREAMVLKVPDISFHCMIIPEADRCPQVEGDDEDPRSPSESNQATCSVQYVPLALVDKQREDTDHSEWIPARCV